MKRFGGCDEPVDLCPNVDLSTVAVSKRTGENHYHVDQPPDSESADREELEEAGADLSDIEPMRAEDAEKKQSRAAGRTSF